MTDAKIRRGIHDPWRTGVPDPAKAQGDTPVGAHGSPDAMDWDLVPHKWYVLRVGGAALKIVGVDDPVQAVLHIIRLYRRDTKLRSILDGAGFTDQAPATEATGFIFKVNDQVLSCSSATSTEDGLRRLNSALRAAIRKDPAVRQHLNHLGIVPLVE